MCTIDRNFGLFHSRIESAPVPVLVLACLLVGVPFAARSDAVAPNESVESSVNIRAAAEAGAEVIGQLRPGERVELVVSIERWHEVALADGRRGFVSADWTEVLDDDEAVTATAAEPPAGETATPVVAADAEDTTPTTPDGDETTLAELERPAAPESTDAPKLLEIATQPNASSETQPAERVADEPDAAGERDVELAEASSAPAAVADDTGDLEDVETGAVSPRGDNGDSSSAEPIVAERGPSSESGARRPKSTEEPARSEAPGSDIEGTVNYVTKFTGPTTGGNSQIFDDGINVGIGTSDPEEPLDVNGNLQVYNRNSNLAAVSLRQSSGEAGYITHNLAGTLIIGAGSEDRITILGNGNVGVGTSRPMHPLEMANGAHVTAGGVWTNASSRDSKQDIEELGVDEAMLALGELKPVLFSYKADPEDAHVGFIAEDAPELVASKNRRGLSAMDIVAVLTRVVQAQQQRIEELESRLDATTWPSRQPGDSR